MKRTIPLAIFLTSCVTINFAPPIEGDKIDSQPIQLASESPEQVDEYKQDSSVAIVTCSTPPQLVTDLDVASQDDVISLSGINPLNCPEVQMSQVWSGGKLIFSDSPEKPVDRAKLYQDTNVPATDGVNYHRIYAYHVNGKAQKMKFTVLIKNTGTSAGTLTIQKKGIAGPSNSYLYTGKMAFMRWLESTSGTGVNVAAGATVKLDIAYEVAAATNYLMHGIWDYSMTQPHQVMVCAVNEKDNSLTVCPGLATAARDANHQRGTFPNTDKIYDTASGIQLDTIDGIQQFPLAGNTTNDTNAVGVDATDGTSMTLVGNYGILYKMHLNMKSSDAKKFGVLINPRGGAWGGAVWAVAGVTPGGKFLIPETTSSLGDNTKGAVEGKYNPGTSFAAWAQFMPTGGSSFPLRFVIAPF